MATIEEKVAVIDTEIEALLDELEQKRREKRELLGKSAQNDPKRTKTRDAVLTNFNDDVGGCSVKNRNEKDINSTNEEETPDHEGPETTWLRTIGTLLSRSKQASVTILTRESIHDMLHKERYNCWWDVPCLVTNESGRGYQKHASARLFESNNASDCSEAAAFLLQAKGVPITPCDPGGYLFVYPRDVMSDDFYFNASNEQLLQDMKQTIVAGPWTESRLGEFLQKIYECCRPGHGENK